MTAEIPSDELLEKVWQGARIDQDEALALYGLTLEELGALADRRRQLARAAAYEGRGGDIITYIVDRNVNYTNVCNVYCKFCAFYRVEKDDDAYVISLEEMDRRDRGDHCFGRDANPDARGASSKTFDAGAPSTCCPI